MDAKSRLEFIQDNYPDVLIADGFDKAIMGIVERFGMNPVVLYNKNKCINIMIKRDGMTEEEAIEFYYYNIVGAHMGDYTPCFAEVL
jgi:hypothetical protein|tara:strand:- start:685 stop:945 length:261 start_codon:yes stop_codon:yes gene_type:complete